MGGMAEFFPGASAGMQFMEQYDQAKTNRENRALSDSERDITKSYYNGVGMMPQQNTTGAPVVDQSTQAPGSNTAIASPAAAPSTFKDQALGTVTPATATPMATPSTAPPPTAAPSTPNYQGYYGPAGLEKALADNALKHGSQVLYHQHMAALKAAEQDGVKAVVQQAMSGASLPDIINTFNTQGPTRVDPTSVTFDRANGVITGKNAATGAPMSLDIKKAAVLFGIAKPDEYQATTGIGTWNQHTGLRPDGTPAIPYHDPIKLLKKDSDGNEYQYIVDPQTGLPIGAAQGAMPGVGQNPNQNLSKLDNQQIKEGSEFIGKAYYGDSLNNGMDPKISADYAQHSQIAANLYLANKGTPNATMLSAPTRAMIAKGIMDKTLNTIPIMDNQGNVYQGVVYQGKTLRIDQTPYARVGSPQTIAAPSATPATAVPSAAPTTVSPSGTINRSTPVVPQTQTRPASVQAPQAAPPSPSPIVAPAQNTTGAPIMVDGRALQPPQQPIISAAKAAMTGIAGMAKQYTSGADRARADQAARNVIEAFKRGELPQFSVGLLQDAMHSALLTNQQKSALAQVINRYSSR